MGCLPVGLSIVARRICHWSFRMQIPGFLNHLAALSESTEIRCKHCRFVRFRGEASSIKRMASLNFIW